MFRDMFYKTFCAFWIPKKSRGFFPSNISPCISFYLLRNTLALPESLPAGIRKMLYLT